MTLVALLEAYTTYEYVTKKGLDTVIKIPVMHGSWIHDFKSRFVSHELETNTYLLNEIKRMHHKNIIDTGAHVGDTGIFLAKALKDLNKTDIKIVMIEPHIEKVHFIRLLVKINELENLAKVIHGAVGKETGCIRVIEEGHAGGWKVQSIDKHRNCTPMLTLDTIVSDVGLMHIDVEGHEWDVLDGSKQILQRDRPVLVIERIHSNMDKIEKLLRSFGYQKDKDLPPYDESYKPKNEKQTRI